MGFRYDIGLYTYTEYESQTFVSSFFIGRPWLFQCDPSGAYFAWKSTAMGKNYVNGKTFLEKRYDDKLELEDAVHTAILTLKEGFEGQMTEDNIEIGICNEKGFRRLSPQEVKDYLANIA